MKRLIFILFALSFSLQIEGVAQSSLVPSYHPVYEWLYLQRVKGVLPDYDYESLPLNRATILEHLKELELLENKSVKEEKTLQSFLEEFDPTHLNKDYTHSLFERGERISWDRFKGWISNNGEKHLYSGTSEDGFIILDHGFGRRTMFVEDGDESHRAPYILNQHWRSYGDFRNIVGYHTELIRAVPVGYDKIFNYDGFYSYNWKSLIDHETNNFHWEAYLTAKYSFFEGTIGRGNLKEGVGMSENLVFSRSSIAIDWIRLKVGKPVLNYTLIHGKPTWRSTQAPLPSDNSILTKNSPERWLAYHKVNIQPLPWIDLSVYEMINYSNRGAEISYLNPVNRYAFAEWELQDQDNGWMGASMVLRPFTGLEAYTELLVDDLGNKKDIIFKKEFPKTSRFGRKYGASYALKWGAQLWSEYTRIDPFLYSHPYDLNGHLDKGIGLGSQVGPNGDRLEGGLKIWGVGRTFVSMSYSYNRQGLDVYDTNGERTFLAGASVNDGRDLNIPRTNLFLDGDLHSWHRLLLEAQWEFKRGYVLKVHADQRLMIEGNQRGDQSIIWADIVIGF